MPDSTEKILALEEVQEARQLLAKHKQKRSSKEELTQDAIDLGSLIMKASKRCYKRHERRKEHELCQMMEDTVGKYFTTAMTDRAFRSDDPQEVCRQITYLLKHLGIPSYLNPMNRFGLAFFHKVGRFFPKLVVPLIIKLLKWESQEVIAPGERVRLNKHLKNRFKQRVRMNLNHLGEAVLGEDEARVRLETYIEDLKNPNVEYISVKVSTLYSQLNMRAFEETLHILEERLCLLYETALSNTFTRPNGEELAKFVNLDMEEYRDLSLTIELFKRVLNRPELQRVHAGIVLQSYIPDSHLYQKELIEWAEQRVNQGGAPIKVRLVKGANLAMERIEASLHNWPQTPFLTKSEVDSHFKFMLHYGMDKKRAKAVNIGVASHNIFDIAYTLLLRAEKDLEKEVQFEMLEGMAPALRRVIHTITGDILLYCPAAKNEEFHNAIAYLVRRLDENTGEENFLRQYFGMEVGDEAWKEQVQAFKKSCSNIETVSHQPRRTQNRSEKHPQVRIEAPFTNESDTDWALRQNQEWAKEILLKAKSDPLKVAPVIVGGREVGDGSLPTRQFFDPSNPRRVVSRYCLADLKLLEEAFQTAKSSEGEWQKVPVKEKSLLLFKAAELFRSKRGDFLAVMLRNTSKTLAEGDPEYSEGIDFIEYYRKEMEAWDQSDPFECRAKGTIAVIPPWNFPFAIPLGGIVSSLITGNCVIFKPAPQAVSIAYEMVKILWEAGIPKNVLQFFPCDEQRVGEALVRDERLNGIILTGGTSTAKKFIQWTPKLKLMAETGGKNSLIITPSSDRDQAIKDLIHSAFSHSGQKCSAASLAILVGDVYEDSQFWHQLVDAASSLPVGSTWNLLTQMGPVIDPPGEKLLKGLTELQPGQSWALKPKPHPDQPNLWTPGIIKGVKRGDFQHQTEFFGPVLAVMKAHSLEEAIEIANDTPYGLTSGLHSLNEEEHRQWIHSIEAGNLYINRSTTGAIVRRQPFGGCKASNFGPGYKAGGPHYLIGLQHIEAKHAGPDRFKYPNLLDQLLESFSSEEQIRLKQAFGSYSYWWQQFMSAKDVTQLVGQDNFHYHVPISICLRISEGDEIKELIQSMAAALISGCQLQISYTGNLPPLLKNFEDYFTFLFEDEETFCDRIQNGVFSRLRVLSIPSDKIYEAAAKGFCAILDAPVQDHGRLELLHYIREISLCHDYHRYGNLGLRENESRSPIQ